MEKYISNYTGEQIDAILAEVTSKVGQTDLETLKTELLARLQGSSANQDGYKDPILTKEFANGEAISSLNTWLDNQFFAIKDGVYYRNGQSGTFTISKDVPQCLINISFQGVKLYVFNSPRSFASGTFEQIAIGVTPISGGGGITWGSGICRRQSTYNFDTQQATWSAWESLTGVDKAYVDEQRISYVSPCFTDCAETHEAKLKSITLASSAIPFKTIFSVTLKIANNLNLLNQSPVYMHLVDLVGNVIGVSQNAVRQVLNKGKYVTWFFDSAINTIGAPFVIKLHTTNSASSASDSNLIGIIAHVSKDGGMAGSGVTSDDGTYHTDWTPAIGINVVNLAAIYPQIKELQKYRMAYATSELPDISTTGHKANIKEIRISQNTMGISLVSSVSLMVASDNAYSGELYLKVHDINDNLVATSNNSVRLSQNLGKYVTWYFTPFQLTDDAIYRFAAWDNSGNKQIMRIHVASGKSEGVTCFDQYNSPHTDYCPALGLNVSAIIVNDLHKSIKEVNLALGNQMMELSMVTNSLSTKMTKMEGHFNIADLQYLGISPIKSETLSRGNYITNATITNLQVGETINIQNDNDGNIASGITLGWRQTITCNAYIVEINTNNTATVLAVPNSDNICIYTNNDLSNLHIALLTETYHFEYQIYNTRVWDYMTSAELQLELMPLQSSISKKVDKVTGKGLSTNDFTNDYKNKIDSLAEENARVYNFDTLPNVGDYFSDADIFTLSVSNGATGAEQREMLEVYREVNMMGSYIFIYIAWRGEPILYSEEYYQESNIWIVNQVDNFNDTIKRLFIRGVNNALGRAESKITSLQSKITALETRIAALEAK